MRSVISTLAAFALLVTATAARAEFSTATNVGAADSNCRGGSFFDPRNGGECWSCPSGTNRTIFAVDSDKACEEPASEIVKKASFEHAWGCDGDEREFFDPRKGGECWTCPKSKPRRTAYPVTDDRACATTQIFGEKLGPAKFQHKFEGCSGGAFFDPRKGGQCWSCPKGTTRTIAAVTADNACSKLVAASFERATKVSSRCPSGAFSDPNGSCYTCPKSASIRTIYPVTGPKACASSLVEAFVPELPSGQSLCRDLLSALGQGLSAGEAAKGQLMDVIAPYLEPVRQPLERAMGMLSSRIESVAAVSSMLNQVAGFAKPVVDPAAAMMALLESKQARLRAMMLDGDRMCSGDTAKMIKALRAIIPDAGNDFVSISLTASFKHPSYAPRVDVGLTFATNLLDKASLSIDVGVSGGVPMDPSPLTVTLSGAFYKGRSIDDFALSAVPATQVSLAKGGSWDEVVKKWPAFKALTAVDAIDLAWNWDPKTLPAFGISKTLFSAGDDKSKGAFAVTGSAHWSIPLVVAK